MSTRKYSARRALRLTAITMAAQLIIGAPSASAATAASLSSGAPIQFTNVQATTSSSCGSYCTLSADIGLGSQAKAGMYTFNPVTNITKSDNDNAIAGWSASGSPYQSGGTAIFGVTQSGSAKSYTLKPNTTYSISFSLINNGFSSQAYTVNDSILGGDAKKYMYNVALKSMNATDSGIASSGSSTVTPVVSLGHNDEVYIDAPLMIFDNKSKSVNGDTKYIVYDITSKQPNYFSADWSDLGGADGPSKANTMHLSVVKDKSYIKQNQVSVSVSGLPAGQSFKYMVQSTDPSYKYYSDPQTSSSDNMTLVTPAISSNLIIDSIPASDGQSSYVPVYDKTISAGQSISVQFVKEKNTTAKGKITFHITFPVSSADPNVMDNFDLSGNGSSRQAKDLVLANFNAGGLLIYLTSKPNSTDGAKFNLLQRADVEQTIKTMQQAKGSWSTYDDPSNHATDKIRQLNYMFGTMFGQLLQEDQDAKDYFSSDKNPGEIDSKGASTMLLGAGQGGPYQINDYAADFKSENALGLSSLYAIRKTLGFQPSDDAAQLSETNPSSLENMYFAPIITAYFHANDVMRLNNIASGTKCSSNIRSGSFNYADMMLNAMYNAGPNNGYTTSMVSLCDSNSSAMAKAGGANDFDNTSIVGSAGSTDTYARYPRQVHYYLDQLYGSTAETNGQANNASVQFTYVDLQNSLVNTLQQLSYVQKDSAAHLQMHNLSVGEINSVITTALNKNGFDSGHTYDISNMQVRARYMQLLIDIYGKLDVLHTDMLSANSQSDIAVPTTQKTPVEYIVQFNKAAQQALPTQCKLSIQSGAASKKLNVGDVSRWISDNSGNSYMKVFNGGQLPAGKYSFTATATNCGGFEPTVIEASNTAISGSKDKPIHIFMNVVNTGGKDYLKLLSGNQYWAMLQLMQNGQPVSGDLPGINSDLQNAASFNYVTGRYTKNVFANNVPTFNYQSWNGLYNAVLHDSFARNSLYLLDSSSPQPTAKIITADDVTVKQGDTVTATITENGYTDGDTCDALQMYSTNQKSVTLNSMTANTTVATGETCQYTGTVSTQQSSLPGITSIKIKDAADSSVTDGNLSVTVTGSNPGPVPGIQEWPAGAGNYVGSFKSGTGSKVTYQGSTYECHYGGWCNATASYKPGDGSAAWDKIG